MSPLLYTALCVLNAALIASVLGLSFNASFEYLWAVCIVLFGVTHATGIAGIVTVYQQPNTQVFIRGWMLAVLAWFILWIASLLYEADKDAHLLGRFRTCVYRGLEGRYCDEFPAEEDVTPLGAIGGSLSSVMFIIGAIAAFAIEVHRITTSEYVSGYYLEWLATVAALLYFVYLGVVSTGYHATHCYDWWRLDIGAVRSFAPVVAIDIFSSVTVERSTAAVKFHSLTFAIPFIVTTFTRRPFWDETEDTPAIVIPGIVFCSLSVLRDMYNRYLAVRAHEAEASTRLTQSALVLNVVGPASVLLTWLVGGAALLVSQGAPGACGAPIPILEPVALAHATLGFVPIGIVLLRDHKVPYMCCAQPWVNHACVVGDLWIRGIRIARSHFCIDGPRALPAATGVHRRRDVQR